VVSGNFREHLESILVAGSGSGCIQSYCPGAYIIELLLQLTKQVLKPQQSCCSDDMLKFEHCGASLGVSRELG